MEKKIKTVVEKSYPSFPSGSYFDEAQTGENYHVCSHYEVQFSENLTYDISESVKTIVEREVAKARSYERAKIKKELKNAAESEAKIQKIRDIANEGICFGPCG